MKFDDSKLISLAKSTYYGSEMTPQRVPTIPKLFEKEELNNDERNQLIDFVDKYRSSLPRSMTTMKRELLTLVGFKDEYNSAANTVNRRELEAIYNFVMNKVLAKN